MALSDKISAISLYAGDVCHQSSGMSPQRPNKHRDKYLTPRSSSLAVDGTSERLKVPITESVMAQWTGLQAGATLIGLCAGLGRNMTGNCSSSGPIIPVGGLEYRVRRGGYSRLWASSHTTVGDDQHHSELVVSLQYQGHPDDSPRRSIQSIPATAAPTCSPPPTRQ